jgi:formate dehydrogenase iron-sulfur subunit
MARHAFSIDLDHCIGCQACAVACGAGNEVAGSGALTAVGEIVRPRPGGLWGSFTHHRCFHCEAAACVQACPTGALAKWDGLTRVAAERCSGCGYCVDACPFQVPRLLEGEVAKCVGCVDLVKAGERPWCEQTCPTQAIRFGEREVLLAGALARLEAIRPRHPEATIYGETQLAGLGLLLVLLDRPAAYGLPAEPRVPDPLLAWQAARPATAGLTAVAALAMGLTFAVARRQRLREHAASQGVEGGAPGPASPEGPDPEGRP